jgi:hypothetical protein
LFLPAAIPNLAPVIFCKPVKDQKPVLKTEQKNSQQCPTLPDFPGQNTARAEMNYRIPVNRVLVIILLFFFVNCSSIGFTPHKETTETAKQAKEKETVSKSTISKPEMCRECFIVPKSGSHRDLRKGYYFDQEENRCKLFWYSTGAGCIPRPFKSFEECIECCGGLVFK